METKNIQPARKVLLLVDSRLGYIRGLLRGVARYSRLHKHWIFHQEQEQAFYEPGGSFYGYKNRQKALEVIEQFGPDGIIMGLPKLIDEIVALGVPLISHTYDTETIPGIPIFSSDNLAIAKMGAEHFLSRGLKNFAYFGDDYPWYYSRDRGEKFREVISQAGFDVDIYKPPKSRSKKPVNPDSEQQYIADWVKLLPKPVAILANNDDRASRVVSACHLAQIIVPEQAAILGIDDDELVCDLSGLPISSIALNAERAGYEAAELLDAMMNGNVKKTNQRIIVKPNYVVTRRSTDIMAIEDIEIATAANFISNNSTVGINVNDVARAVSMSRRNLERRFLATMGRTILSEIKRVRVQAVKNTLVESNLSITKVAEMLGFTSIEHLSKYFKREAGMTPKQYRNKFGPK